MVGRRIASRKSDELITSALEERIRNQRQGVYLYSNMRKARLLSDISNASSQTIRCRLKRNPTVVAEYNT